MNLRQFDLFEIRDLNSRLNVIVGPNAKGKTTILESLSLFTTLKSFRTPRLNEVIKDGQSQASVTVDALNPVRSHVVVGIENQRKQILVDGKSTTSSKYPFLGGAVSFVPDDLYLVKGSPEARRDFLDELGVSLNPAYAKNLQHFIQVLKQRNRLLKAIRDGQFFYEEYALWTEKFIEAAVPVYQGRIEFVQILNDTLPAIYKELFGVEFERISVEYEHNLHGDGFLADTLLQKINQLTEAERAVGHSLAGPHRDDLLFKINGLEARAYGSQGQIRGLVVALKISQLELTRTYRQWSPILLLDDIISEFDDTRCRALVDYLASYSGQLFVTTAEIDKVRTLHQQFSGFKIFDLGRENPQFQPLKTPTPCKPPETL